MKGDGEPTGFSLLPTPPSHFVVVLGIGPRALLYRRALLTASRYAQSHLHSALAWVAHSAILTGGGKHGSQSFPLVLPD